MSRRRHNRQKAIQAQQAAGQTRADSTAAKPQKPVAKGGSSRRFDSIIESGSGRGGSGDRLTNMQPASYVFAPSTARHWYQANGFAQNIIDAPADDATRKWITLRTNADAEFNISRLVMNRMEDDLSVRERLRELLRIPRMYDNGGFMFYGVDADLPQTPEQLMQPMPANIRRLEFLNVFGPDYAQAMPNNNHDPISRQWHRFNYYAQGRPVHHSRIEWAVNNYMREEATGVSTLKTILDAIKGQDTALWSVTHMLFEMSVKVFSSPSVDNDSPAKIAEFLEHMKAVISTIGAVALGQSETLSRIGTAADRGGLKEAFDFLFENLAGLAKMPKSRLMGQSQGVLTAGQYDMIGYFNSVEELQENKLRKIINKIIKLIVHENTGEVYQKLGGKIDRLDWEFEFNPLWTLDPAAQADVDLKRAQRDQIDITSGVITPPEARRRRPEYKDLEDFPAWEGQPLDFTLPEPPPIVTTDPAVQNGGNPTQNGQPAATAVKAP